MANEMLYHINARKVPSVIRDSRIGLRLVSLVDASRRKERRAARRKEGITMKQESNCGSLDELFEKTQSNLPPQSPRINPT